MLYFLIFVLLNCPIGYIFPDFNNFNCYLPNGCFIERLNYDFNDFSYEKNLIIVDFHIVRCSINSRHFQFRYDTRIFKDDEKTNREHCAINPNNLPDYYRREEIFFEWPRNKRADNELLILDKSFDLSNVIIYLYYFYRYFFIRFISLGGIDINLSENSTFIENTPNVAAVYCVDCTMNFYRNGRLIKSCGDMLESNSSALSIFQIALSSNHSNFGLYYCEYPTKICPLVFRNFYVLSFILLGLVDSFYKKNTLTFHSQDDDDDDDDLNSRIYTVEMEKVENIDLNTNLLNPSVFRYITRINIYGSVNSIEKSLFRRFTHLREINFQVAYFRKFIHKNGIEWISEINRDIYVDIGLWNSSQLDMYSSSVKFLTIACNTVLNLQEAPLFEAFPDEDFCVYRDFPFNKLVILMQICEANMIESINTDEFTCTYLWLIQYIAHYYEYYDKDRNSTRGLNSKKIIDSKAFRDKSKCNFESRVNLCNKSAYKIKEIWSTLDNYYLNKKLQIGFKISSYFVSLVGICFNLLNIVLIVKKDNSDLFKEFKQYSYLWLNSTFSLAILIIHILSWMTECFFPFELFCPEIRKLVAIQLFKIIAKECLTSTLRFMLNFTYRICAQSNRTNKIGS